MFHGCTTHLSSVEHIYHLNNQNVYKEFRKAAQGVGLTNGVRMTYWPGFQYKEFYNIMVSVIQRLSLTDPRGDAAGACSRQQDPILSFLHTFLPKSTCVRGQPPQQLGGPPQREILDPPLILFELSDVPVYWNIDKT